MRNFLTALLLALGVAAGHASEPYVNPVDFGALFDGVTDDTAAWNATIAAAVLQKKQVRAPCGNSLISSVVLVPDKMTIAGGGQLCTVVSFTPSVGTAFSVTTSLPVRFEGLTVKCTGAPGLSTGILVEPDVENTGSSVENVQVTGCRRGISMTNARQCYIHATRITAGDDDAIGLIFGNLTNPDHGDCAVSDSGVNGTGVGTASIGVYQKSGGGLKITNFKIIGWGTGLLLKLEGTTSDLLISNSSIENTEARAIVLTYATPGATFRNVVIVGNEFSSCTVGVVNAGGAGWLDLVIVAYNRIGCTTKVNLTGVPTTSVAGNI